MDKVCLIKAGHFTLGINTSHIASFLNINNLKRDEFSKTGAKLLYLKSFLTQKHHDISGSEILILKKINKQALALLIDNTVKKITFPTKFEPYPLLHPELAEKCCPKIFIHENQIVLLIYPKQLIKTIETLRTDHGLITLKDLMPLLPEKHTTPAPTMPDNPDIGEENRQSNEPEPEIDDKTISTLVAWTFNKFNSNEKMTISAEDLPKGLIQQQGLGNELLQQLIDQTVLQCEKTRYETMKNTIKKKLNDM